MRPEDSPAAARRLTPAAPWVRASATRGRIQRSFHWWLLPGELPAAAALLRRARPSSHRTAESVSHCRRERGSPVAPLWRRQRQLLSRSVPCTPIATPAL